MTVWNGVSNKGQKGTAEGCPNWLRVTEPAEKPPERRAGSIKNFF